MSTYEMILSGTNINAIMPSFGQLFAEQKTPYILYKGKKIMQADKVHIPVGECYVRFSLIETNSEWKQGFAFRTEGAFYGANNFKSNKPIVCWEDYFADGQFAYNKIKSKNGVLLVYNVWDTGNGGMDYWHNGGAMYAEKNRNKRIYYCNDGYPDDDFNDLIFEIEILTNPPTEG